MGHVKCIPYKFVLYGITYPCQHCESKIHWFACQNDEKKMTRLNSLRSGQFGNPIICKQLILWFTNFQSIIYHLTLKLVCLHWTISNCNLFFVKQNSFWTQVDRNVWLQDNTILYSFKVSTKLILICFRWKEQTLNMLDIRSLNNLLINKFILLIKLLPVL